MSQESISTRRQRRAAARRDQILDAAATVFADRGFHAATTREIAAAADVSEGTIYNYFDSKDDLLISLMTSLTELETLDEEMLASLQGNTRAFFVEMFRHRADKLEEGQKILQAVLPAVLVSPQLRERFYQRFVRRVITLVEQHIQTRVDMGHIRPVEPALAARAVQALFLGLLILRLLGDETLQVHWDDMSEVMATIIFDGLGTREGGE